MTVFTQAKWICPRECSEFAPLDVFHKQLNKRKKELPEQLQHRHFLMRGMLRYSKANGRVKIRLSADDYYKLSVNGRFVCPGPAQGYYFNYYWNETDITDYLSEGENEILADVYYQGFINRAYNSGDRRIGLIAEIFDDSGVLLSTDEAWECSAVRAYSITHVLAHNTMVAENFDSRIKPDPWENCAVKEADYTFSPKPATLLQVYEKAPATEEKLQNGIFYDFGQELTATLKISARGKSGSRVRILCGEETEDTPEKTRFMMRCGCHYEEWWTLDEGENLLEQYDYKAFRYVTLVPDEDVEILSLCAVVRHHPFDDEYCTLETDDEVLRSVWQICKNGVKFGSQEVFVDCPSREKGQYAGDLTVTSAAQIILTGDLSLFEKALENQMQSAFICKGLMAVTPGSLMQEIADYSLQFPILALRHYAYTGDKGMLSRTYKTCLGIVEHFRQFERDDGLLQGVWDKWNLVDWPKNLRDGYDFPLESVMPKDSPAHNVLNAFYVGCVLQTEEIARILGEKGESRGEALKEAFHRAFYNEKTGLFTDCEESEHSALHSNVIPAFYGIQKPSQNEAILALVREKGLSCGVYMAYFVLKALCGMGYFEDAYRLIVNRGEHSWYNMVREGATTCFEAWGKEQKWNTSLCHPWASAPISLLAEDVLPALPQYGRIVFRPKAPSQRKNA
ncbi:MAG: family 78 glycoside hydrolase catalytic domain [Clostridia bacterium]|nr:family 78 glycoside hydrolase catalytic domain [Clostridia bacterium]